MILDGSLAMAFLFLVWLVGNSQLYSTAAGLAGFCCRRRLIDIKELSMLAQSGTIPALSVGTRWSCGARDLRQSSKN